VHFVMLFEFEFYSIVCSLPNKDYLFDRQNIKSCCVPKFNSTIIVQIIICHYEPDWLGSKFSLPNHRHAKFICQNVGKNSNWLGAKI
jgi:hypothetical protein